MDYLRSATRALSLELPGFKSQQQKRHFRQKEYLAKELYSETIKSYIFWQILTRLVPIFLVKFSHNSGLKFLL